MSERGTIRDFASGLRADMGPGDRWLSVYEVGAMTLQSPETVRRWVADGVIPAEDRGRLGLRIRESDVEKLLGSHFVVESRAPADHGLSSNVVDLLQPAAAPNERETIGAGWPFNHRTGNNTVGP